ncbi:MAG: TRAP transporter small permease subunit [Desulfobacteraceae bacterium]|jgi:TRAP-type mannitol/chloroaromatic compound transport system permease small subunit
MKRVEESIGKIVDGVGYALAAILILMVLNVAFDVMMRYLFRNGSVGMQEMEWHFFSILILFGVGFGLRHEGHVRVDFIYDRLSEKKKAVVNILGTLFMLFPLASLILLGSFGYVNDAYITNEISEDPGGLPYRWIIKSMIPLSFTFLLLSATGYVLKNIEKFREAK